MFIRIAHQPVIFLAEMVGKLLIVSAKKNYCSDTVGSPLIHCFFLSKRIKMLLQEKSVNTK
jgi:hypothetical protein